MAPRERISTGGTRVFSSVILVLGLIIVVRTVAAGGGPVSVGVLMGLVFVAIGAARLFLSLRASR